MYFPIHIITSFLYNNYFLQINYILNGIKNQALEGKIRINDNDIDFNNNMIHVRRTLTKDKNDKVIMGSTTKTGGKGVRDIVMDDQIKYIINDYLDNHYKENKEHLLFYNINDNKYFTTNQINSVFKRLCEKHNIGKGFNVNQHMLRHTFATRCIEAGMPAVVLQRIMGHKDLHTTLEVYCDVFANYEKQHTDRTYNYLKDNDLLLINMDNKLKIDYIPQKELEK